jgi:hypothetical protein
MDIKKCSCTRKPQPIDQFLDKRGREVSTCLKCRKKAQKFDQKAERREYHNELQKEKEYYKEWRAKQLKERPDEYRGHNNDVFKEWCSKNPTYMSLWNRTHVNSRLSSVKSAAEKRNIEWKLTDEEAKLMMVSPCIYCKHIDLSVRVNGIDRIDSAKTYTTENCRPCCKNCNYMKGTFDPETFIEWAKKISKCDAEFPEIPKCHDHKKMNRRRVQGTQPETPTIL